MLVLPLLSVAAQAPMLPDMGALMGLVGKWSTFWVLGARLFLAGLRSSMSFTQALAKHLLETATASFEQISAELGYENRGFLPQAVQTLHRSHPRLLLPNKSMSENRGRADMLCLPTHDRFVPNIDSHC